MATKILVHPTETSNTTQSIFKIILSKAKEIRIHKVPMLRIKEGAKISSNVKDSLTTRVKARMQKHQMELKVNATLREKILEAATIQTRCIRDADLTNFRYKIKLGGIVALYRIYLVLIKCLSCIHSSNSNYLH